MAKNKLILLFLSVSLLFPLSSKAAGVGITLAPSIGNYNVSKSFDVNVIINPNGQTFDTARVQLKYPSDLLEIKSFLFGPAFSATAGENGFDNSSGIFTYGAGIPEGTSQSVFFGTITFRAKSAGSAKISLDPNSLILSDGANIFDGNLASASYNLQEMSVPEPTQPETKDSAEPVVAANSKKVTKPVKSAAKISKAIEQQQPSDTSALAKQTNNDENSLVAGIVPIATEQTQNASSKVSFLDFVKHFIFSNVLLSAAILFAILALATALILKKFFSLSKNE